MGAMRLNQTTRAGALRQVDPERNVVETKGSILILAIAGESAPAISYPGELSLSLERSRSCSGSPSTSSGQASAPAGLGVGNG